jgi:hypothetical protein
MKTLKANKIRWVIAVLALALALGVALALPSTVLAEEVCPFGEVDCTYPGDCSRYVDVNNDGICDLSQTGETSTASSDGETVAPADEPTTPVSGETDSSGRGRRHGSLTTESESSTTPTTSGSAASSTEAATVTDSGGNTLLTHYYVSPIAIGFFLIYALSFVLYKTKRIKIATHRKVWNVLLLVTFLVTGIFGLILTIQLDYRLPFQMPVDLLFWHVEAGIVMTLISLFHIGWHFKYYAKMFRASRSKARAAESEQRYPAQRGTARGHATPIPERVHALESRWDI